MYRAQTVGRVTGFTCATGTAGTLAGVSRFLKSKNPAVKVYLADPPGSVLHNWFQSGVCARVRVRAWGWMRARACVVACARVRARAPSGLCCFVT